MTIYAAQATYKGRTFYQGDKVTSLSLRRLVMLGACMSKGWQSLTTIAERIDDAYQAADKRDKEELYEGWRSSEILRDLFDLARLDYVELATYKASTGLLYTSKPQGMMFVDKTK